MIPIFPALRSIFGSATLSFYIFFSCVPRASATGDLPRPRPQVYLASPYGFSESTDRFRVDEFRKAVTAAGCEYLDPWGDGPPQDIATLSLDDLMKLGEQNAKLIDQADGMIAALDGPDIDSGTAAEIGYAAKRGIWIIGYRSDKRLSGETGQLLVNLQVEYFMRKLGRGTIVSSLRDLTRVLKGDDQNLKRDFCDSHHLSRP